MFENKFALLGFGTVVAAGLVAAYVGLMPGKPVVEQPAPVMNGSGADTAYSARGNFRTSNSVPDDRTRYRRCFRTGLDPAAS